jgi:hypothetical protein
MNNAQRARLDQLLEQDSPQERFIETKAPFTVLVECTCGWKYRVRKRSPQAREVTIRVVKNMHLMERH